MANFFGPPCIVIFVFFYYPVVLVQYPGICLLARADSDIMLLFLFSVFCILCVLCAILRNDEIKFVVQNSAFS